MFYCYWFSLNLDLFIFCYAINFKNKGTNVIVVLEIVVREMMKHLRDFERGR